MFGIPRVISTDRGSQLVSKATKEFCDKTGIRHEATTANHQQADATEATIKQIKNSIRKTKGSEESWQVLDFVIMALRAQPNRATSLSPAELMYGQRMLLPIDLWKPSRDANVNDMWEKRRENFKKATETITRVDKENKEAYDARFKLTKFKPGDRVLVYNYYATPLDEKWIGPFKVTKEKNGAIEIKPIDGTVMPKNMHRTVNTKNARRFWKPVELEEELENSGERSAEESNDSEVENGNEDEGENENGSETDNQSSDDQGEVEGEDRVEKVTNHRNFTSGGWKLLTKFENEQNARWIPIENFYQKSEGEWVCNEKAQEYVRKQRKRGTQIPWPGEGG
jgi:hypothetical protein